MLKGFRDFLMRGNVLDLAVAVVIGTAFTAIVTAFTENIVNPLIAAIGADPDIDGLGFFIRPGVSATFIDIGSVITAIINFIILAAVVYFVLIVPFTHAKKKLIKEQIADEEAGVTDIELLTDIRDLLANQRGVSNP
ncbi:large conductance mechanosensitive channel protein MscL [Hoyosella rhizosphaerae]|uniref:Large-conductance mechanosensitive channel n=1 Tax=Hoyosella rhizosphaerae TaxID=1755582 RepID=A0A916XFG5_9ACTN|nr:large conductance mechanosensitive channel protein MscL [Hoyosella rhizosphaerae]MBN4925782.1 large conductance mechanosensitive channel protein MscL [Hoyosella rhizosphaerae]GGC68005.1 large conductance mechanosensitive channel protein MscL [Hoyosella rhizosphaerae]